MENICWHPEERRSTPGLPCIPAAVSRLCEGHSGTSEWVRLFVYVLLSNVPFVIIMTIISCNIKQKQYLNVTIVTSHDTKLRLWH